jgi:hypothetical protein
MDLTLSRLSSASDWSLLYSFVFVNQLSIEIPFKMSFPSCDEVQVLTVQ